MIEKVVHPYNLQKALKQVIINKGSAGVDGVSTREIRNVFREKKLQLIEEIKQGNYQTQPILGIEIPKGNGKTRLLGIPTTTERVLQQAVSQSIAMLFEPEFKSSSFGFRPNKNARQAVAQALEYIHQGLNYIVDTDLKTFFDEVDHCLLLNLIYKKVKCKMTLKLIRRWLKAPIKIKGKLQKRIKGVPQGSPLSPLLSNILLHELDKEMTIRGHKFVRYADDFSIYCKSENQAKATKVVIEKFLKNKLKLTINQEKSGIRKPVNFTILGFGFVPTYEKVQIPVKLTTQFRFKVTT
jgi:RNA-directed DNA polymerase